MNDTHRRRTFPFTTTELQSLNLIGFVVCGLALFLTRGEIATRFPAALLCFFVACYVPFLLSPNLLKTPCDGDRQ